MSSPASELDVLEEAYARYDAAGGKELLAVKCMERALAIRASAFASTGPHTTATTSSSSAAAAAAAAAIAHTAERIVLKYNALAVRSFQAADGVELAEKYLLEALRLTEPAAAIDTAGAAASHAESESWRNENFPTPQQEPLMRRLRSTTLNNFGCLERRRGKLHAALSHLLAAEAASPTGPNVSTQLNISAVQAQLGRNDLALVAAKRALALLDASSSSSTSTFPGVRAIAFHNLAAALESTPDADGCLAAYRTAFEEAVKVYGLQDRTPQVIERNMRKFEAVLRDKKLRKSHPTQHPVVVGTSDGGGVRAPHPPHPPGSRSGAAAGGGAQSLNSTVSGGGLLRSHNSIRLNSTASSSQQLPAAAAGAATANEDDDDVAALLQPPPVDLQLTDDELRGVVPERVVEEAVLLDTNTTSHRSLKIREDETTRRSTIVASGGGLAGNVKGGTQDGAVILPQPPNQGRRNNNNAPQRAVAVGGQSKRGEKGGLNNTTSGNSGSGGGASEGKDGLSGTSTSASYIPPAKPLPPIDEAALEEEARKNDDLVGFVAQRLAQLLKAEDAFETRYQAAVRIQCMARKALARMTVTRKTKQRAAAQRGQAARESNAARRVIRFFRMLVKRRRDAEFQRRMRVEMQKRRIHAVIKMQSVARMWLAKQFVIRLRKFYARFFVAVNKIQCWWRQVFSRHRAMRMRSALQESTARKVQLERRTRACVLIQSVYRRHRAAIAFLIMKGDERKALQRDWQRLRTKAATSIQRVWRGHTVRRHTTDVLRDQKKRRTQTQRTLLRRRSATRIQAVFRGYLCRKTHRFVAVHCDRARAAAVERRRRIAAVRIQCLYRRFAARQEARRRREARFGSSKKPTPQPTPPGFQHPVIDLEPWL